ncbi:MAG: DUF3473 domain-containing protein [Calditrichales bacterium]|nr:DUF3473 domain-containing protein [Calditrichales bacterium]
MKSIINNEKYCFLTFDIEEWFQVENLKSAISYAEWKSRPSSVERNTDRILSLLNMFNIRCTFFVLGWVAERYPKLIRKISEAGHEVASHGYSHELTYTLNNKDISNDVCKSKQLIEDITGQAVTGYRAPSFSVDDRLIDVLKELAFDYDSSYSPFKLNNRYGVINRPLRKEGTIYRFDNGLIEMPLSMLKMGNWNIPVSGGAYFRLLPLTLFKGFVKQIIKKDRFYVFYLHPWEFEPDQPRIKNIRLNHRIRHYTGLKHTEQKLERLIQFLIDFNCKFLTMQDYVNEIEG